MYEKSSAPIVGGSRSRSTLASPTTSAAASAANAVCAAALTVLGYPSSYVTTSSVLVDMYMASAVTMYQSDAAAGSHMFHLPSSVNA